MSKTKISREEGIRTLDTVTRIPTFQAGPFNHSGTSLICGLQKYRIFLNNARLFTENGANLPRVVVPHHFLYN